MREFGHVEGRDYGFAVRYAEGDLARYPLLAEELVHLKPDVIVSGTMAGTIAVKKLTDTIPIVSESLVDPMAFGWVASHARPGGNVTGVLLTVENLPSKQLALAVEMVPGVNKIGLLVNPGNPSHPFLRPGLDVAAKTLGVELVVLEIQLADDLHAAFQSFARDSMKIVLALPDASRPPVRVAFRFRNGVGTPGYKSLRGSMAGVCATYSRVGVPELCSDDTHRYASHGRALTMRMAEKMETDGRRNTSTGARQRSLLMRGTWLAIAAMEHARIDRAAGSE